MIQYYLSSRHDILDRKWPLCWFSNGPIHARYRPATGWLGAAMIVVAVLIACHPQMAGAATSLPSIIQTETTGSIAGKVVAFDAKEVRFNLWNYDGSFSDYQLIGGQEGNYRFDNVPSGTYQILVSRVEFDGSAGIQYSYSDIVVTTGTVTTVDIWGWADPNRGVVAGKVVDASGQPLAGITVEAHSTAVAAQEGEATVNLYAVTNAGGLYQLINLFPGHYRLRFYDNRGHYAPQYYENTTSEQAAQPLEITAGTILIDRNASLAVSGAISGEVMVAGGASLQNLTVSAYHFDGSAWETVAQDSTKKFLLRGLPEGHYRLGITGWPTQGAPYQEFYRNAATLENATDIMVTAGMTVTGLTVQIGDNLGAVLIDGPSVGNAGVDYHFTAAVSPLYGGTPITYSWYADDPTTNQIITQTNGVTDTVTFNWATAGTKSVRVVADNGQSRVESVIYPMQLEGTSGLAIDIIDTLAGEVNALAGSASTLYVGMGAKLLIVEASSPNNPQVVGQLAPFADSINGLAYVAPYLYVAAGHAGLRVIDVTQPKAPVEIGQYTALGKARQVVRVGAYAYVLDETVGLAVVDVANPTRPTLVDTFPDLAGTAISVDGQRAFIHAATAILIVDIANPKTPTKIGTYTAYNETIFAAVKGYLYLANPYTSCQIVDIRNPQTPAVVGNCGSSWQAIQLVGDRLYTNGFWAQGFYQGGIWVYDVADPLKPVYLERYAQEWGMATQLYATDRMIAALHGQKGLGIIPLIGQQQPYVTGALPLQSASVRGLIGDGNYGYYVRDTLLNVLALSHSTSAAEISQFQLSIWGTGEPQLALSGNYIVASNFDRAEVIDVSNRQHLKQHTLIEVEEAIYDVALAGRYGYLLVGGDQLQLFDLQNAQPTTPISTLPLTSSALTVAIKGQYAYLGGEGGLQVVQLTNPRTPQVVAQLAQDQYIFAMTVADDQLYLLERTDRWNSASYLTIYSLATPAAPTQLGRYGPDYFSTVIVEQQQAYLATSQGGLSIVDVSNPAAPTLLGQHPLTEIKGIIAKPPYLYVASETAGLSLLWTRPAQKKIAATDQAITFVAQDETAPNGITYQLPANTLQSTVDPNAVPIARLSHTELQGNSIQKNGALTIVGQPYLLQAVDAVTADTLAMTTPATVEVRYTPALIAGMEEPSLAIYYVDGARWRVAEPMEFDLAQHRLRAQLPKLTPWALFAVPRPSAQMQSFLPIIMKAGSDPRITHVELTQAIQTLTNDVPLVAGRPTTARIYAITDQPQATNEFKLTLSATRDGKALPGSPLTIGPWAIFPQMDRGQLSRTFNFSLPLSWSSGNVRLTATLQPPVGLQDRNPANNQNTLTVTFQDVPPLDVKIVPIRYKDKQTGTSYGPPEGESFSDYVMRTYPIHAIALSTHTPVEYVGDLQTDEGWGEIFSLLASIKQADHAADSQIYLGLLLYNNVPPYDNFPTKWGGLGSGSRVSVSLDIETTVAHEIGHNLWRAHAPCGNPGGVDEAYPYAGASIGEFGLDLQGYEILTPGAYVDFMSYCGPSWISDYTYRGLLADQLSHGVVTTRSANQRTLLIRTNAIYNGKIQEASLLPIYSDLATPSAPIAASDWSIRFIDPSGVLLAEYPVVLTEAEEFGVSMQLLSTRLLMPDQTPARIQLNYQGQLITERILLTDTVHAAAAYQVEQTADRMTLHWSPTDSPVLIRYTNNDGQSWTTLAVDALGGTLQLDPKTLPGGTGRFAIIPADLAQPLLTAANAAPTILLPDNLPQAWITGPDHVQSGAPIILFGHGADPEDGVLETLAWTVNGKSVEAGQTLQLSTVNNGEQIIQLTVMDSSGQMASAEQRVVVGP